MGSVFTGYCIWLWSSFSSKCFCVPFVTLLRRVECTQDDVETGPINEIYFSIKSNHSMAAFICEIPQAECNGNFYPVQVHVIVQGWDKLLFPTYRDLAIWLWTVSLWFGSYMIYMVSICRSKVLFHLASHLLWIQQILLQKRTMTYTLKI